MVDNQEAENFAHDGLESCRCSQVSRSTQNPPRSHERAVMDETELRTLQERSVPLARLWCTAGPAQYTLSHTLTLPETTIQARRGAWCTSSSSLYVRDYLEKKWDLQTKLNVHLASRIFMCNFSKCTRFSFKIGYFEMYNSFNHSDSLPFYNIFLSSFFEIVGTRAVLFV